ncbi:hypothetical protein J8A87_27370 [Vibrio parahaemolyticus]|uniref:hypothetical protein n=1 Tax=Vibrio TaxID=662 RepID=UPI00057082E2|nr:MULTISPECIES: hypothetical protein [Vibrio]MBE4780058.1 hypothetical protein [Vibrio parahaemolyticus]MCF9168151.1 hypothetical protein [Vibrio parahaemolyticus]MDW1584423.1 hypothetical protein [Vibrio sp. Vb2897]MDW1642671.1 hypothetical protein [Vibrio sp. Vb2896]
MFPENDKPCLSIGAFKHKKSFVITTIESLEKYAVSTQKRQVLHLNLMSLSEINLGGGERRTTTKWWL